MKLTMNPVSILTLLLCLPYLLAETSQAASSELSAAIQRSQLWVTIVYSVNPIAKGILIVDPPKKWRVAAENGQYVLNEIGQNTLSALASPCLDPKKVTGPQDLGKFMTLTSSHLNINELEASDFDSDISAVFMRSVCGATHKPEQKPVVRSLANGDFTLDFISSKKSVLFVSADHLPTGPRIPSIPSSRRNQILKAPFGASEESFQLNYGLKTQPVAYLHHDLAGTVDVSIDPSFPAAFRPAIADSLQEWNQSLRKSYFSNPRVEQNSIDQCISERKICFRWDGPAQVTIRGMSCQAQYGFDPSTGLILGGMINCWSPSGLAIDLEPRLTQKLEHGADDFKLLVELSTIGASDLHNKRHPYPLIILRHLIVHELGHFFGFGHNFKASVAGTFENPAPSVMDYYPAALVSPKTTRLGPYDRNLLNHIYSGEPISTDYQYCSDADATPELYPKLKLAKMADCNQSDFGDPLTWLWNKIELTGGLFGTSEELYGNSIQNSASFNAFYIHPVYKERARALICSAHLSLEEAKLLDQYGMNPSCQ